jgi:N-acetylglutamate synthase
MMEIRKMAIEDHSFVKELWSSCQLSDEIEDQIEEIFLFLNSPQSAGYVALENEKIAGAVLCGSDGRYGYIYHLAVAKFERKKGIGKNLVKSCVNFLNRRHIIIMVRESNEAGNAFWSQLQFQNANELKIQFLKTQNQTNSPTADSTRAP